MKMIDKIILEQFYLNRPCRFYSKYAPAIRSERTGLLVEEVYEERDTNMCNKRESDGIGIIPSINKDLK